MKTMTQPCLMSSTGWVFFIATHIKEVRPTIPYVNAAEILSPCTVKCDNTHCGPLFYRNVSVPYKMHTHVSLSGKKYC